MVLVLLGEKDELLQMAHNDEMITVSGESILYLALEDKLSKPFNYGKDEKKLFLAETVSEGRYPFVSGSPS